MSTNISPQKDDTSGIVFNTPVIKSAEEKTPLATTSVKPVAKNPTDPSHLGGQKIFDVEKAFTNSHGEEGTIVSDKRRSRPTILESLGDAWNEWLLKTKKNVEKVIESTPTLTVEKSEVVVAAVETRREVVAEAAMHANIAPKDDHHKVVEKLRTMGGDTERITGTPITIAPAKTDTTKGSWSHYEEKDLLEKEMVKEMAPVTVLDFRTNAIAPEVTKDIVRPSVTPIAQQKNTSPLTTLGKSIPPQKVMVAPGIQKKRSSIIESAIHIAPRVQRDTDPIYSTPIQRPLQKGTLPLMKHRVQQSEPELPHIETPKIQKISSNDSEKPKIPAPAFQPTPPPPTPTPKAIDESPAFHSNHSDWTLSELAPTHIPTSIPAVPQEVRTAVSVPRHTQLTWVVLGGIVLLGVTLALIASIYIHVFRGKETLKTSEDQPRQTQSFIEESDIETITLTEDARTSLTSLHEAILRVKPERTEIRLAVIRGEAKSVATAREFLTLVQAQVSPNTLRALHDTLTVGSITTTETAPYFVFRTSDFDSLFAGLLEWENTLYADFMPLFGTNPIARTMFEDSIVEGRPARVLVNDAGLDVVTYGFLGRNTVILTKNRDALSKLFLEL